MPQFKIIDPNQTLEKVKAFNVLIKAIRTPSDSNRYWDFLIKQLVDPMHNRPVKPMPKDKNPNWKYNPKTGEWSKRNFNSKMRGAAKDTIYTKKTSVSLLPPKAKVEMFKHGLGLPLGLMFDLEKVDLKDEKYVFAENINSDQKPWLKNKEGGLADQAPPKSIGLEKLRALLTAEKPLQWSELLVGLTKESVIGIYFYHDILLHRLRALTIKALFREKLGLDLPIFWLNTENGLNQYPAYQQAKDLEIAKQLPPDSIFYLLSEQCQALEFEETTSGEKTMNAVTPIKMKYPAQETLTRALYSDSYYNNHPYEVGTALAELIEAPEQLIEILKLALKVQPYVSPLINDFLNELQPEQYADYREVLILIKQCDPSVQIELPINQMRNIVDQRDELSIAVYTDVRYGGEDVSYVRTRIATFTIPDVARRAISPDFDPTVAVSDAALCEALTALKGLRKFAKKYQNGTYDWESTLQRKLTVDEVEKAQGRLLRLLPKADNLIYDISAEEKTALLYQFKQEMDKCHEPIDLLNVFDSAKNNSVLNHQRHFFRKISFFKSIETDSFSLLSKYFVKKMNELLVDADDLKRGMVESRMKVSYGV